MDRIALPSLPRRRAAALWAGLAAAALVVVPAHADDAFRLPPEMAGQAVFGCDLVRLVGNVAVTAEGVATGSAVGSVAHVRADGDVAVEGNARVEGDAVAAGAVTLSGQPATILGATIEGAEPLGCLPVDLADLRAELEAANDNAALPSTDKGKPALGGADGRAFALTGRDGITLPAGTYLFSSIDLKGNSQVRLAGRVRILVTGPTSIAGGSQVHLDGAAHDLRLWSLGATVDVASQSSVAGFVYAPAATVKLAGQSRVVGAVWGDAVEIAGGSRVVRRVDDRAPSLAIDEPEGGATTAVCEVTVAGTATDAEGVVTLLLNGEPADVADDGTFSSVVSLWTDDPGLVVAEATDVAGNTTRTEVRLVVAPPAVSLTDPAPGALVGDRVVDLAGDAGTATSVTVDGAAATVAGGRWTLAGFDLGADGLVTLDLAGTNCAGTETATAVVDLDTTPPAVAVDSPTAGALYGASPITVAGTVTDAHLASVTVDGVAATVDGERFTAAGVALVEGTNELVAVARDALGRETTSAAVAVTLDTTAPTVTITAPAPGAVVGEPTLVVEGTVSDPHLDAITVNGVAATVDGTTFRATVTLAEGENTLVAEATDAAGNAATSPSQVAVLDTLPPELALDAAALPELTAAATVTATGTVADPHLDTVTVNGIVATVSGGTFAAEVPLAEGANEIVAEATDTLGHVATTAPATVERDSLPPEVEVTSPAPGAELSTRTIEVTGTVADPHLDRVTILGAEATVTGDAFTATVELPEGASEVTARAVDTLGHAVTSAAVPVTVDTLPPVVRLTTPAEPVVGTATVTVSGTVEEPHLASLTVTGGDGIAIPASVDADGAFAVAGVPLAEGANEIVATARDTFGHEATSTPVVYVLDTTPPVVTIAAPADGAVVGAPELTVTGTVVEAHLFALTVAGVEATVDTTVDEAAGAWSVVLPLAEGANPLVATAEDRVGLTGEARVTVVLDTAPPVVTVDAAALPALTADGVVTVTGTVSEPHLASLTVAGVAATVADGAWSADVPLAEGENVLVAEAVDVLGRAAQSAPAVVVRDATPPTIAITAPADGAELGDATVVVAGTVTDAHLESVTVNGTPAVVAGGAFQATLTLPEGSASITAVATDAVGQSETATITVTVDSQAPVVALDPPPAPVVADPAYTATGTATDAHLASVTVAGVPATLAGDRFTAAVTLAEGPNALTATATDTFAHTATSAPIEVVLDTIAPEIAIGEPAAGALLDAATVTVTGTVADANLASVDVNGVAATVDAGTFSVTVTLAEGPNDLVATARDAAGHETTATVTVDVDTGAPEIAITAPPPDAVLDENTVTVTGTVSDPHLASVDVNGSAATVDAGTFTATVTLVEGANDLVATARDAAGHEATATVAVVVDTIAPEVAITSPAPDAVLDENTVTVTGTVSDANLASVDVNGSAATVDAGTFTATVTLVEGANDLVATARDAAGHEATATVAVVVDTGAPVVTLDPPAEALVDTATVTLTGTVSDPHLAGVTVGSVAATVDGETFSAEVSLGEGANTFTAEATDTLGHVGTSNAVAIELDTTAPEIAIGSPAAGELIEAEEVTVTGTVADPNLATVTVDGVAATLGDGTFTALVPVDDETFVAVATDALGHTAEATVTVVLDDEAPRLTLSEPIVAADACLEGGATTLRGTYRDARPAATPVVVEVTAAGATTSVPAALAADGTWTAVVDLGAADGVVTVAVVGTDAGGATTRLVRTWRVDATAPTVTLLEGVVAAPGAATGATPPAGKEPTLFARPPAFAATVEDGAAASPPQPVLTLDGAAYAAGTPVTAEGEHTVVARATDCAGRTTAAHLLFRVDTTPPALHATQPTAGALRRTPVTVFRGTSDPDLATATVAGRPATVLADGGFELAGFPWREGANRVAIQLTDAAGHGSTHAVTFRVDTSELAVEILESGLPIGPGTVFRRAVTPEVLASDVAATLTVTLDGAPFTVGTTIEATGDHVLAATATNGHGDTASASVAFAIDTAGGPTISITSPVDGETIVGETVTVAGTVAGRSPRVDVDGVAATVTGGTWTASGVPLDPTGTSELVATAVDAKGLRAQARVLVLRGGGPVVTILEPADGFATRRDRVDVAGAVLGGPAATADGTVTVTGPAAGSLTVLVAADGTFRARDVALQAGENLLAVTVTGPGGAVGRAEVRVQTDLQPPAIELTADGAPLVEAATFSRAIVLGVRIADDSGRLGASLLRLSGEARPITGETTEIPLTDDGGYVVAVTARDEAGNEARAERSFVLDLGGCALSDVEPAAGTSVLGDSVTLRGRVGAATALRVRVPGHGDFPAALADGTFLAGDVPLPVVGENALRLVCVDPTGAESAVDHPLDRAPAGDGPVVDITAPASGALRTGDTVTVTGTTTSGTVTVNGVVAAGTGGAFSAVVPLVEGPNILAARAVDAAGRVGRDRVVIDRDTTAPRVVVSSPEAGARLGVAGAGPASVDVTGSVDLAEEPHLQSVTATTAAGSVAAVVDPATGVFTAVAVPLDPAAGAQTITVVARDAAGHEATVPVSVTLDATGPAVVLTAPADLTRYTDPGSTIAIAGEAWAGDGATVSINGTLLDPASLTWSAPGADGRRHVTFATSVPLPAGEGPFGVVVRATELDGRVAHARRLLVRDTVPPQVLEVIPADGSEGVSADALLLVLFSEPVRATSLVAQGGLELARLAAGTGVVGHHGSAGNAVAFAPGTALAAGEQYRLTAGTGIVDVAGNPLAAAVASTFRVAAAATADAPVLDPLPAVVCAPELVVTGAAAPGAAVQVRDGSLVFTGFADAAGAFAVTLPLAANGYHLLHVRTVDESSGALSPEATAVVRVDCSAPTVRDATFDRAAGVVTVALSEALDPTTVAIGDAVVVADGEAGTAFAATVDVVADPPSLVVTLAGDAWADRPVRLVVGPPAADPEGNVMAAVFETVFFPGASGGPAGSFLFGEVYDDATGRPLGGATATLFPATAPLPGASASPGAPVAAASSEGRGRYTLAGEVAPGRYALVLEKPGHTRAVRRLALEPATGAVPFDARLTPRAAPAGEVDASLGGTVESAAGAVEVLPGGVPGTAPVEVTVTGLSGQGLPDFLPLGWTPAAAAELVLVRNGQALPESTPFGDGKVWVELPLAEWVLPADDLVAVRYDLQAGVWTSLGAPQPASGPEGEPRARFAVPRPGTVAVVVADVATPPPAAVAGEALSGVEAPSPAPALEAEMTLDPPVVAPTGRATARVVARSSDGATPWPSGLLVQAFLEERLFLAAGGGQLLEAPFSADLVLYHPRLAPAEAAGAAEGAAGAVEFSVSPSPRAAQVLLDAGWEDIRLFPFPEAVEREPVVGPPGGAVTSPEGVELVIPDGALAVEVPVAVELLTATELAALPPVLGYRTLAAVRVDLRGHALARPATLRLPVPAGTPAEIPGEPRLVLAELVETPPDRRGVYAALMARAERVADATGERIVASPEQTAPIPVDGLVREGLYLVLHADAAIGYATGHVRSTAGAPLELSRVTAPGLGTAAVTAAGGRYAVPVPAGTDRAVEALHPTFAERATATIASLLPDEVVEVDVTVAPVPPRVTSLQPADGAADQPVGTTVAVAFSEALDPASVFPSTLQVELLSAFGASVGLVVEGEVTLSPDRRRVVFASRLPLLPSRAYRARFAGGVRDAEGVAYAGGPVEWSFTTAGVVVIGGEIVPEKFHLEVPVNGRARVWAEPGAVPISQAGQPRWSIVPVVANSIDPTVDTIPAALDGSVDTTAGHPPAHPVTIQDEVWVKVLDPTGDVAAHFRLGPFVTPDGRGVVARPGEETIFTTIDGIVVTVPAAAFNVATLVRVTPLAPSSLGIPTPEGLALGAYVEVDFEGEAAETLRLAIPAPADAADDAVVLFGAPFDAPTGRRHLRLLSVGGVLEREGAGYLSNDRSLQPEPPPGSKSLEKLAGRSCEDAFREGLSQCYIQSMVAEFTLRSLAAAFYSRGVGVALLTGPTGFSDIAQGAVMEAITNSIADTWIYVPSPQDWHGRWILPVLVDAPLEIVRRDLSTGWVSASTTYDPATQHGALVQVGFLSDGDPGRPRLLDASPFEVLRFAAPAPGEARLLRMGLEARGSAAGVALHGVSGFPLAEQTGVAMYDMAPTVADPSAAPMAGPRLRLCGDLESWSTSPVAASDDLVAVVTPGRLDPSSVDRFELQFDRPLAEIAEPDEAVRLLDLGPIEGCAAPTAPGYPRRVPVVAALSESASRLIVVPLGTLPAGHHFRLELEPSQIATAGSPLELYWPSAPHLFDFATAGIPAAAIGSLPGAEGPPGSERRGRQLLKLGNLGVVATEISRMLAIDASESSSPDALRIHAYNVSEHTPVRAMATDGHNRVFYTGLFGAIWSLRAARLEDMQAADHPCPDAVPGWAEGLPCFAPVTGSAQVSFFSMVGSMPASAWLAAGATPIGNPGKLEVLTQDETGNALEVGEFVWAYRHETLAEQTPVDPEERLYAFDVPVRSTYARSAAGDAEPSGVATPAVSGWRELACPGEPDHDRYQRVTVDNLTTGQSWSTDVENPWPGGAGNGSAVVSGVRARPGDRLQVRYNVRALGYASIVGSGLSVFDLNRFYRLPTPTTAVAGWCGRRLARLEGQHVLFPDCAYDEGSGPEGLAMSTSVAVHSATGCADGACRGASTIDVYSPLLRIGAVHSTSPVDRPGALDVGLDLDAGELRGQIAACIRYVDADGDGQTSEREFAYLRDVVLGNGVEWIDHGIRGTYGGAFTEPRHEALRRRGDLLFLSMGMAGIFVFDVSERYVGVSTLVGHLHVDGHTALTLHVDEGRGLLFAHGDDLDVPGAESVVDVWDIASINGAPNMPAQAGGSFQPRPVASLALPWGGTSMAIDAATGLVYTWDHQRGLLVTPIEPPRFRFGGIVLAEDGTLADPVPASLVTDRIVPLGVPMETTPELETANREANHRDASSAFRLRIALPGSLGPELTARVQSLRALPPAEFLGRGDVGAAVATPGGPGWPDHEVTVTLRRVGQGSDEAGVDPSVAASPAGQLGAGFNLYESIETVVAVADPRASRGYVRQDAPETAVADEAAQCRRCDWPPYLDADDPRVVELLVGGRWVRAFLAVDAGAPAATRNATEAAIEFFEQQGANYPLPVGWVRVAGVAAAVPSPHQVSLAESPQNPAMWSGEAGAAVSLESGEALVHTVDHQVRGRALPFAFERAYRSGLLGYGPFGSAGWSGSLFAHLSEIETTGEIAYHDGRGHVWRFFPRGSELPEGWEDDPLGSYAAPVGVYLRLQKLQGRGGWRLLGRQHDALYFDEAGRLVEISDRHRQGKAADEQGSTLRLEYDAYGQLVGVVDDLGRRYALEYEENPSSPRFGLLVRLRDFVGRTVEYEWNADRTLVAVRLPEVKNESTGFGELSYEGAARPTVRYTYGSTVVGTAAPLHGGLSRRLEEVYLPAFVPGVDVPRLRFEYDAATGRTREVSVPTRENQHSAAVGDAWTFTYSQPAASAGPVAGVVVREPWGHPLTYTLENGRVARMRQPLVVTPPSGDPRTEQVGPDFTYAYDGRLTTTLLPDGGERESCYPDGCGTEAQGGLADRLLLANVVRAIQRATTEAGKGSADYSEVDVTVSYHSDNLPAGIGDGLGRPISMAVPSAAATSTVRFGAENVSGHHEYDRYGRTTRYAGGGDGGPEIELDYAADAEGNVSAGLVNKVSQGGAAGFWKELEYDAAWNVEETRTSFGAITRTTFDDWDRAVRVVSGLSDGPFAPVGAAECAEGKGAVQEMGYDPAGHLVRERRLQDHVDADGEIRCRWVETRYRYNAREQLVAVEETHLASPDQPGLVIAAAQETRRVQYDEHGRVDRDVAVNLRSPDLVTQMRYDAAGRVVGVKVGDAGEQVRGFDVASRVVLETDGHEAVNRYRYDVWDRVFHEVHATGAVVLRRFDEAHNPTRETTFDADPLTVPSAEVLADVESHFTSFGQADRVVEVLSVDGSTGEREVRVTEQHFDESGRVIGVFTGPPAPGLEDAPAAEIRVDAEQARREVEITYEIEVGRPLLEQVGGVFGEPALAATRYTYSPESRAPWPDTTELLESVPGEVDLVSTLSRGHLRDVLGRPIREIGNDGSAVDLVYDRSGGAIRTRTGAQTVTSVALDGRGLPVRELRPAGRGETRTAYDLDGRPLRQVTAAGRGEEWTTAFTYDATGRVRRIDHADGTVETATYHPDSTVATHVTRDGLTVTFGYDAANRLRSATPSGTAPSSLVPLDTGDRYAYDLLSRPTLAERGAATGGALDASLAVAYEGYDLASRPAGERVGGRTALGWSYDTWDRPTELRLPGVARSGTLAGFDRAYDTLDRLDVLRGAGEATATPLGAAWHWGGGGRIYGVSTRGELATSVRFGYLGGRGPSLPGAVADAASQWKLGAVAWGSLSASQAGAGAAAATQAPEETWDAFGFGWRGDNGDPRDGAKTGRLVGAIPESLGAFAGMGWSWSYDAAVRLQAAIAGRGSIDGRAPPEESASFAYGYGPGDELETIVREDAGDVAAFAAGSDGRITSRDGVAFAYDAVGRRTEDDRFRYRWTWRGELAEITVKDAWPGGVTSPFAGHQVHLAYDAVGRLHARTHLGPPPAGGERPFVERRVYVWEGESLLAELGYGDPQETQLRWRKTYVPGPSGLDDAVQVAVEVLQPGSPYTGTTRLYTYLRDELGTVVGLVAEDEATDPERPPVPVRYLYTPYGEAHAELGPELRALRFDNELTTAGGVVQDVADSGVAAAGGVRLRFSLPLDPAALAAGLVVEKREGAAWSPAGAVVARSESDAPDLLVLLPEGWQRDTTYRIGVTTALRDVLGRPLAASDAYTFSVPSPNADNPAPPVLLEESIPPTFETYTAAGATVGGRFPGGQTALFQGLWTDPVTGLSYARARWLDPRNATWLSEDPAGIFDSTNRYAFVAWQPNQWTDPRGEAIETGWDLFSLGVGLLSLAHNVGEGNWAEATTDAFGIGVDAVAVALPLIPGGASVAIKGMRAVSTGERVVDYFQTFDTAINVAQGYNQAMESYREGDRGWAAFYGGMAALGVRGMAKAPLKVEWQGAGSLGGNVRVRHAGDAASGVVATPRERLELPPAPERLALPAGAADDYVVSFFGSRALKYYDRNDASLGASGEVAWLMSIQDAGRLRYRADVVTQTGHAPSVLESFLKGEPIYGIAVPKMSAGTRVATVADSGGYRHFRPGGVTGVEHRGAWRANATREWVTEGGNAVPRGSVLFRFEVSGEWTPIRRY